MQSRMDVTRQEAGEFILRFTIGGLVVASVPLIAQHWSPRVAGALVLFPALTVGGLTMLWLDRGTSSTETAAVSGLFAVPAVAAYLFVLWLTLRLGGSYPLALGLGVLTWLVIAALTLQWGGTSG